jgi:hypothetical protein
MEAPNEAGTLRNNCAMVRVANSARKLYRRLYTYWNGSREVPLACKEGGPDRGESRVAQPLDGTAPKRRSPPAQFFIIFEFNKASFKIPDLCTYWELNRPDGGLDSGNGKRSLLPQG